MLTDSHPDTPPVESIERPQADSSLITGRPGLSLLAKVMIRLKAAHTSKILSKWLSDESLTKKAYLNALAAILDYGARLVVAFMINPVLVAGLGDYFYG